VVDSPSEAENDPKISIDDLIGEYNSIFVNFQDVENSLSSSLTVSKDGSFSLVNRQGELEKGSYTGRWRSYTENGAVSLLCTCEEPSGRVFLYFTLTRLDDGTLKAEAQPVNNVTAFGGTDYFSAVTFVLFEKK